MSFEAPTVEVTLEDRVAVAVLGGEIDLASARTVGERIRAQIPNSALGLIVDLTGVTYLDSSGVQLLFDLGERLRKRQQELRVALPAGSPIRRVLEVVELARRVRIHASASEAAAEVRAAE